MSSDDGTIFNITSHGQQGGITAGQVNFGNQQRNFNDEVAKSLKPHLPSKEKTIDLVAVMGDGEAFQFANQIKSYLEENNYMVDGVSQVVFLLPVKGLHVEETKDESIKIIIGNM